MDQIYSVSSFVASLNQILENAFSHVVVEGEVSEFRISKNRWVYFKLKDDHSSINVFATVYQLNTPIEDGMKIQVKGTPKLHNLYGFSLNMHSFSLKGEGTIKKSLELLMKKLKKEGLFAEERKRTLPQTPYKIAVVSSTQAAGYKDFITVVEDRWPLVDIKVANVAVQGESAPEQIVKAIEHINLYMPDNEVIVLVRGGGSAEDLMSFSDERVVRAVAMSKIPTLVGVGHERDTSLADLAADVRAATPTDAARLVLPDKKDVLFEVDSYQNLLSNKLTRVVELNKRLVHNQLQNLSNEASNIKQRINNDSDTLLQAIDSSISSLATQVDNFTSLLKSLDPNRVLKLGYSIVKHGKKLLTSSSQVKVGDNITIDLSKGKLNAEVNNVEK